MISVVLAIHNEAHSLSRCLDSVIAFADEIIVVDGESTDDSVAIAQNYNATIITTTNKSNFHINKQMAMDAARGDLILQLDADEVVDPKLADFITSVHKQLKNSEELPVVAWWLRRKNYFLGTFLTKGGQYPDSVIRLYLAGKARLPQQDVHEQMQVDGAIGQAKGHLIHYSNPTFAIYIKKFNTYTSFAAQQLLEKKVRPTIVRFIEYCFLKPLGTFFSLFIRHRGYVDGIPGFVFALMSGLHHPVVFLKLWEHTQKDSHA